MAAVALAAAVVAVAVAVAVVVLDDRHSLAERNDDLPVAPADDDPVGGFHLARRRVVGKLENGRAVGGEAEERGLDLGLVLLAVVRAEGQSRLMSRLAHVSLSPCLTCA
jgi:hypothetical protein